jgi:hypothetical protein
MMKTRAAASRSAPTPQACADCLVPENLMRVSSARHSAYPKTRST